MLRICLDDHDALLLLTSAAEDFARGSVPEGIFNCFTMDTMTALQQGGTRGIATSTSFRRLVAKTMAKQFMTAVEQACAPFQFALPTRAGRGCVGHAVQPPPSLRRRGQCEPQDRATRGEQGDPTMPLLFSLAVATRWRKSKNSCSMANFCSHSWTTCTCGEARPHSDHLRLVERQVVHDGKGPTSHGQDPHVEPCGSVPKRCRQCGVRKAYSWNSRRKRRLRSKVERRTDRKRGTTVARDPLGARSAKWMANPPPMCQPEAPPFPQDVAAQPVGVVR